VLLSGATVAAGEGRVGGYSGHGCYCEQQRCTAELNIVNNPVPIL
jgi:hypothetical protein